METKDRDVTRSLAGSGVVVIEALVLGAIVLGALSQVHGSGACGEHCRAATPFLVVAAALCAVAFVGIVTVWLLARSAAIARPERFVSLLGIGLLVCVLPLLLVVFFFSTGSGLD